MRRYLFKTFFIFSIFIILPCFASVYDKKADIKTLSSGLPEIEDIQCSFKQEKILKNVQKPILSGGNFKFKKGEGAYFETTYPLKSSQTYPEINKILNCISNKNYQRLEKRFDFYFEKENGFKLLLVPKPSSGDIEFIKTIQIEGKKNIEKITIEAKGGDKIIQWFYQN